MITAIAPGSYDPVTNGHVDVIARAAGIFDRVVVGVVGMPHHKEPTFAVEERVEFLRDALASLPNVELDVTLRDGRTLHVYDDGDPDGQVVVEHHGTPGSGLPYPPDIDRGRERGLRIVRFDRAGYGGSTPKPGRSVADVVPDVEDVLEALEVERYVALGGSGGCPH